MCLAAVIALGVCGCSGGKSAPAAATESDIAPFSDREFTTVAERLAAEIRRVADVESPDDTLFIGYPRTTPRAAELVSPGLVEALVHATQDRLGPYARFHEPQVRGGPYRSELDAGPGPEGAALRLDFSLIRSEDSAVLLRRAAVAWRPGDAPARPKADGANPARSPAARAGAPRAEASPRAGAANPSQDELRADVTRAQRGRMPAPEPELTDDPDPEHAPQEPRRLTSIRDIRRPSASRVEPREVELEPRDAAPGTGPRAPSPPPGVEERVPSEPEAREQRSRPPGPPPARSIAIDAPERQLGSWLVEQWPNLKDRTFRSRDGGAVVCLDAATRAALSVQAQRVFARDERMRVELDARAAEQVRRFRVRAIFLDADRQAVEVTPVIVQELLPNYTTTVALTAASGAAKQYVLLVQLAEDVGR